MNKTKYEKIEDILVVISSIVFIISVITFFTFLIKLDTTTKYATIKGESFTIPKIEGAYYYER